MAEVVHVRNLRPNTRPVDPDVKIPAAVTRAREAAEAAQRAAYPENQPPEPAPSTPSGDNVVIADPPEAPSTPLPTPAVVTPQGNPAPSETLPAAPPAEDSWEHKFKSSEGRRVRLEQMNTQLVDRLGAVEALLESMRSAPPTATPAPTPPAPSRLVTDAEENEFGTEMLDVMGRRAREIVSPELVELRNQMAAMEQKLTGTVSTVQRNARQDMLSQLDTGVPDWRRINDLDEFKAWLALPDPYFGVNRHSELLKAFAANDTSRVRNFFTGFISELAVTDPAPGLPIPPAVPQPAKPGLESLAAPGRARTPAAATPPDEKQIITTADVNAFYDAKRRGAYVGREDEFNRLEQELFRAQREGRVRSG